jgi:OFA family oxalate/formate antiporter-like MFS transporter
LTVAGHTPVSFVLLAAVVFFAWGEIFSIFPSTMRDHFGQRYATTNYGMLYIAKGVGSLLVPISGVMTAATGSWNAALFLAAAMNVLAAILAIAVLWPLRVREIERCTPPASDEAAAGDGATEMLRAYPSS